MNFLAHYRKILLTNNILIICIVLLKTAAKFFFFYKFLSYEKLKNETTQISFFWSEMFPTRLKTLLKRLYKIWEDSDFSSSKGIWLSLIFACDDPTYSPSHWHWLTWYSWEIMFQYAREHSVWRIGKTFFKFQTIW